MLQAIVRLGRIQLQHRLARIGTGILHPHGQLDMLAVGYKTDRLVGKGGIRQAKAKGEGYLFPKALEIAIADIGPFFIADLCPVGIVGLHRSVSDLGKIQKIH